MIFFFKKKKTLFRTFIIAAESWLTQEPGGGFIDFRLPGGSCVFAEWLLSLLDTYCFKEKCDFKGQQQ